MSYICSNSDNNPKCRRVYESPTSDFFCVDCGYDGLLIDDGIEANIPTEKKDTYREVGLCVLLMDASGSMNTPAFQGNPTTKLKLIAINAAKGVFSLKSMANIDDAYICAMKFDDKVEQMFFKTIRELINEFSGDENKFADYLYSELLKMQGTTDINGALRAAHSFVDKFLNKSIPNFQDYTPLHQFNWTYTKEKKHIPNVRVLIYSDGQQYNINGVTEPLENPFSDMDVDILMGAFFGNDTDTGCDELRSILSKCPLHGTEQFFLIDNPSKIVALRKLFRMASGASGFCPLCIPKE
jgi:hypothetical protein